jgi:hypothetical protein
MVMLAAIGGLPDPIMDRAIDIRMRRRSPGEKVAPFRTRRDAPPFNSLRDQLHGWVRGNLGSLQAAVPDLPVEDRAADTWEPLFAIAELAGGDWPARARKACLALAGEDPDDGRIGTKLLADLKAIWGADEEHLFSTTIIERLCEIEESPWSEWGRERKPITQRGLAELLRPYRVKPKTVRERGVEKTSRGYSRSELADPWTRYNTSTQRHQATKKLLRLAKTLVSAVCRMTISELTQALTRPNGPIVTVSRMCRIRCVNPVRRTHSGPGLVRTAYAARPRRTSTARNAAYVASTFVPILKPAAPAAPATSRRIAPHDHLNLCRLQHSNAARRTRPDHTHPCCDPDDTPLPVLSIEEINQLIGDLGQCQDCGQSARSPGLTTRCKRNHKAVTP